MKKIIRASVYAITVAILISSCQKETTTAPADVDGTFIIVNGLSNPAQPLEIYINGGIPPGGTYVIPNNSVQANVPCKDPISYSFKALNTGGTGSGNHTFSSGETWTLTVQ